MTEAAQSEEAQEPAPTAATAGMRVGENLRTVREAQGLSVLELASRLRLGVRQIEALEAGDFSHLPGKTFVRGIVRSYARELKLDVAQLLSLLDQVEELAAPALVLPKSTRVVMPEPHSRLSLRGRDGRLLLTAIALSIVAILLYVFMPGFELERLLADADDAPVEEIGQAEADAREAVALPLETSSVSEAVPLAPEPPAADRRTLKFRFSGESWVEVRDGNDKILLAGRFAAGQSQSLSGTPPLLVTIEDVTQVRLFDNGTRVPLSAQGDNRAAKLRLPLPPAVTPARRTDTAPVAPARRNDAAPVAQKNRSSNPPRVGRVGRVAPIAPAQPASVFPVAPVVVEEFPAQGTGVEP
jgi:cytoskeleton protein RodZ